MGKNDPNAIRKIAADSVNAEKEDGERHPGGHRHRPQEVDRSVEKILDNGIPADQHSERNAGGGGNREAGRNAFEAHEEVSGSGGAGVDYRRAERRALQIRQSIVEFDLPSHRAERFDEMALVRQREGGITGLAFRPWCGVPDAAPKAASFHRRSECALWQFR